MRHETSNATASQVAELLEGLEPVRQLQLRLKLLAQGLHPCLGGELSREWLMGLALRAALREGVPTDEVRHSLEQFRLLEGSTRLASITEVPLVLRSSKWLSWWAAYLPRILISASRGALPRQVAGREYTDADLALADQMLVTAEAEALECWLRLAQWGIEVLYPEWYSRKGKEHACFERVLELATNVAAEDWRQ